MSKSEATPRLALLGAVLFTVFSLCMISCSKDDDDPEPPQASVTPPSDDDADDNDGSGDNTSSSYEELIIGTWTMFQTDPGWKSVMTFKDDGTFRCIDYYDIEGDGTFAEYSGTYYGTYRISDSRLTITDNNDDDGTVISGTYTIQELTASTVSLKTVGEDYYVTGTK